MSPTIVFVLFFLALVFVIAAAASASTKDLRGYFAAHRRISGFQNGLAIAGDYLSAASFLGATGLIAIFGFDGFYYAIGWLMAYLCLLLLLAEPLRNIGHFTIADVVGFRMHGETVRILSSAASLIIIVLYLVAQMVGIGIIVRSLIPGLQPAVAIVSVGAIMLALVVFGGMLATTWVQIVKVAMLFLSSLILAWLVMAHFGFSPWALIEAAGTLHALPHAATNLFEAGSYFHGPVGAWDRLSLGIGLVLGAAGLPHILLRLYTVPTGRDARISVAWGMVCVSIFYVFLLIIGLGAATIVGGNLIGAHLSDTDAIRYIIAHPHHAQELNAQLSSLGYIVPHRDANYAVPILASLLGGRLVFAFVAATALATVLSVTAGLTISGASSFALDLWHLICRRNDCSERERVTVGRIAALLIGSFAIAIAVNFHGHNIAVIVGLAFSVAASANFPALVLSIYWRRLTRAGLIVGMSLGLLTCFTLVLAGPDFSKTPLFPLVNPGIVSVPLAFIATIIVSLFTKDDDTNKNFERLTVQANTGIGAAE